MISANWAERYESATYRANQVLWNKIVSSQQDKMAAEMGAITRDRNLRKLILKGDSDTLTEEAAPTFRRLSSSGIITKQQLTGLDSKILFSMPNTQPGQSEKYTVQQALEQGKAIRGVAMDSDGLVIEVSFPVLQRGKVIGAGIFIIGLDAALADFKLNNDSEVTVINSTGNLEATTNSDLFDGLNISLPDLGIADYQEIEHEGKHYGVTITPIKDPEGQSIAHLVDIQEHTLSIAAANNISNTSYVTTLAILTLVGLFFAWYVRRSFLPIESAVRTMEKISEGDLTVQIEQGSDDEVGRLLRGMHTMSANLRDMLTQLVEITSQLTQSASDLKGSADDSSEGVQSQLSEIDQVATAMNQMTATVHDVAQNAASTASEASSANNDSEEVKLVVESAIASIHALHKDIQSSSEAIQKLQHETSEIGGVLEVIRGIAEQTNLLALNAAIEAARAGEQGRGFAVVADEVRTLAGRTQQSTEDINTMIERLQNGANETVSSMQISLDQVQTNVETIIKTGDSLQTITQAISSINDMNLQIASAAEEQSAVAEEVNRNVVNIAKVAEDSAFRVDQTRNASGQLGGLTGRLGKIVGKFKL